MIVGMNWLRANRDMIDFEHLLLRVRTLIGGELVIHGERASQGPTLCSAARAKRLLHQGCSRFLAYIADRCFVRLGIGCILVFED